MRTVRYGVQASSTRIVIRVCKRRALVWLRVPALPTYTTAGLGLPALIFGSTTTAPTLNITVVCASTVSTGSPLRGLCPLCETAERKGSRHHNDHSCGPSVLAVSP